MGYAFAEYFLNCGASVALWDVNEDTLATAKDSLGSLGTAIARKVDVANYENVETAAADAANQLGGVELLVNAAGIVGVNAPLADYPLNIWNAVQQVNVNSIFHTCRAVVPYGPVAVWCRSF